MTTNYSRHRQCGNAGLYSLEAKLINNSMRELSEGTQDPITKLRLMCFSRGATGILGLGRAFRNMDDDDNKALNEEEFSAGIHRYGLEATHEEIRQMFQSFDEEGWGSVNVADLLFKLRPEVSQSRLGIIEQAFVKMDRTGDGIITLDDVKKVYSVQQHPKYENGDMSKDEILTEFLHNFDGCRGHLDGSITKEEFQDYYASLGATIDNDTYFDLLIRQTYKL